MYGVMQMKLADLNCRYGDYLTILTTDGKIVSGYFEAYEDENENEEGVETIDLFTKDKRAIQCEMSELKMLISVNGINETTLDDFGLLTEPRVAEEAIQYRIRDMIDYCNEKGIETSELSTEEREMFLRSEAM